MSHQQRIKHLSDLCSLYTVQQHIGKAILELEGYLFCILIRFLRLASWWCRRRNSGSVGCYSLLSRGKQHKSEVVWVCWTDKKRARRLIGMSFIKVKEESRSKEFITTYNIIILSQS